eukprot:2251745-Rhodomonas_salina.1
MEGYHVAAVGSVGNRNRHHSRIVGRGCSCGRMERRVRGFPLDRALEGRSVKTIGGLGWKVGWQEGAAPVCRSRVQRSLLGARWKGGGSTGLRAIGI